MDCDIMDNGTWCATHKVGPRLDQPYERFDDTCFVALGQSDPYQPSEA